MANGSVSFQYLHFISSKVSRSKHDSCYAPLSPSAQYLQVEKVCSGFCSFEKQTNRLQRTSSIFITPVIPSCAFVIGHGRYLSYLELVLQALPFSIPKEFISRVLQRVIKKKKRKKRQQRFDKLLSRLFLSHRNTYRDAYPPLKPSNPYLLPEKYL